MDVAVAAEMMLTFVLHCSRALRAMQQASDLSFGVFSVTNI